MSLAFRSAPLVACALVLLACRTVPMPGPTTIEVPPGLSPRSIDLAVVAGILNKAPPSSYRPDMADAEYERMFADFIASERGISWYAGAREGDVRYAKVDTRGHYLRVAIRESPAELRIEIVESRNLLEADGRIHRKVPAWIANLEAHIRRELARMTAMGGPPPPA